MLRKLFLELVCVLTLVVGFAGIVQAHDGCDDEGDSCVCSNTGLSGRCGFGRMKSGLYCRCDNPGPTSHDGCESIGDRCICGDTGLNGNCNTGPMKEGIYCRCD